MLSFPTRTAVLSPNYIHFGVFVKYFFSKFCFFLSFLSIRNICPPYAHMLFIIQDTPWAARHGKAPRAHPMPRGFSYILIWQLMYAHFNRTRLILGFFRLPVQPLLQTLAAVEQLVPVDPAGKYH